MSPMLLAALTALALWFILAFVIAVTTSAIHLLLALGVTLLIRWWALRD